MDVIVHVVVKKGRSQVVLAMTSETTLWAMHNADCSVRGRLRSESIVHVDV